MSQVPENPSKASDEPLVKPTETKPHPSTEKESTSKHGSIEESKAKEFIGTAVDSLLWKRLATIAGIFGVANVAAFVALFWSVDSAAKDVAKQRIEEEIKSQTALMKERIDASLGDVSKRKDELNSTAISLYQQIGRTEQALLDLEQTKKKLDADAIKAANELAILQKAVGDGKDEKLTQILDVLHTFSGADRSLLDVISSHTKTLDGLAQKVEAIRKDVDGIKNTPITMSTVTPGPPPKEKWEPHAAGMR